VDGTLLTQGVSRMVMDFDHLMSARADALFVSHLSARHSPTRIEVETAIRQAVRAHGGIRGCAGEVAAAYGGHPETAAPRMRWARAVVDNLFLQSRLASLGPAIQAAGVDSSASVKVS
jgi:hypothetical protein